jgi:hypothetical protein
MKEILGGIMVDVIVLLGTMYRQKILILEDFRAFKYGTYVVPACRIGRPKGTKALRLMVYFTHFMFLKELWPLEY